MHNDRLKTLRIIMIIALVIVILAALFYLVYSFSLFWQAFAAGITISILLIIIFVLLVLAIYSWIKSLLLKRELNETNSKLGQAKIELNRCRNKLKSDELEKSE